MQNPKKPTGFPTSCDSMGRLKRYIDFWFYDQTEWKRIFNFLVVGLLGFVCNLVVLTVLLWIEVNVETSVALGIITSAIINFIFDRHLVFSYARNNSIICQLLGFTLVCTLGAFINYKVSMAFLSHFSWIVPQFAVVLGAIAAVVFNYLGLRYLVFRS